MSRCPNCGSELDSRDYYTQGEHYEECPDCEYRLEYIRGETYSNWDDEKQEIVEGRKVEGRC